MKREKLTKALGNIDQKFIIEALVYTKAVKSSENEMEIKKMNDNNKISKYPSRYLSIKRVSTGLAVVMVVLFSLVNINSQVAFALEKLPIIGSIASFLNIRTYEDKQFGMDIKIEIPTIEGLDNQVAQENLNKAINTYVEELKGIHEESVAITRDIYENGSKEDIELIENSLTARQSLNSSSTVIADTEAYFSMRMDTTLVMAGGMEMCRFFTVDKSTGTVLILSDLFEKESGYINILYKIIADDMERQIKASDSVTYWPEYVKPALEETQRFYISEKGQLVLAFDEYAVAPGYMGAVEFKIPYTDIKDILIVDFIKE